MFRYRWPISMWAWAFQRVTGLALALYLIVHIIEIHTLMRGPKAFDRLMEAFGSPGFKVGEIVLLAAVVAHALNGTRIVVMDSGLESRWQKALLWGAVAAGVAIFVAGALPMVRSMLGGA